MSIAGAEMEVPMALLRVACPSNLTGLPAISIPCGLDKQGLPMGLQLVGRAFDEATLLRAAYTFEASTAPLPKPRIGQGSGVRGQGSGVHPTPPKGRG